MVGRKSAKLLVERGDDEVDVGMVNAHAHIFGEGMTEENVCRSQLCENVQAHLTTGLALQELRVRFTQCQNQNILGSFDLASILLSDYDVVIFSRAGVTDVWLKKEISNLFPELNVRAQDLLLLNLFHLLFCLKLEEAQQDNPG